MISFKAHRPGPIGLAGDRALDEQRSFFKKPSRGFSITRIEHESYTHFLGNPCRFVTERQPFVISRLETVIITHLRVAVRGLPAICHDSYGTVLAECRPAE